MKSSTLFRRSSVDVKLPRRSNLRTKMLSQSFGGRWANDFPADHIKIDHERERAVADVLELSSLDFARSQRQARRRTLQGLNTSHFVGTDDSLPGSHARRRFLIRGAHVGGLLITFFVWLVFGGCQPRPNQVWLEIHLF